MCPVSPPFSSYSNPDFARAISQKVGHGRFLVIGGNPRELGPQFAEAKREAEVWSSDELASKLSQYEGAARFETAAWFYPAGANEDEPVAEALTRCSDSVILLPGPGADAARRRPELGQCFVRLGFVPDYECDVTDLSPAAVCLRQLPSKVTGEFVAAVETAFARFNRQVAVLRRTLEIRASELEAAHRHIAALEEKLLKLQQYRRELRLLREQRQTLRKSPERKMGQILLAPYRLPEKLAKTIWRKFHQQTPERARSTAPSEYQKWFEQHRASAQELKQMRNESRAFASQPLISVITPVFDTPVDRLEEAVKSVLAQAYENWELLLADDGSTDPDLLQQAGGFRSQFDSAQDFDLFFRVIERTNRIHHIPLVLYHWRRSESSSANSVRQKPGQLETSRLAIEDHLKRRGEPAHVSVDWRTHAFCVRRELSEATKISLIVPSYHGSESLARCVESITSKTSYPNYEIVIVESRDKSPATATPFLHRLLRLSGAPNDSAAKNYAAEQTDGPWLLFMDDNIEVIDPEWLTIMAEHVQRAEVGAVGARLLNPSGTIEHAGIVVGVNRTAQSAFRGFPAEDPGAKRQLQVTRNCSGVSTACMLTRRGVFQQVAGFDESLSGALADVDLCLKMRQAGYLIVYTPFAKLYWHGSYPDKIDAGNEAIVRERWASVLQRDPYYNPNLSRERADFSLGK